MRCCICFPLCRQMIFNGDYQDECWAPGEKRESKLVFIGKNLDHDELRK